MIAAIRLATLVSRVKPVPLSDTCPASPLVAPVNWTEPMAPKNRSPSVAAALVVMTSLPAFAPEPEIVTGALM